MSEAEARAPADWSPLPGPRGYLCLILHAHLPYVRHPEHDEFLEERWLFEAISETYLPLLCLLEDLAREGTPFRLSWSLTPTLIAMLDDELLRDRYERHLTGLLELARREVERHRFNPSYREVAQFYAERFELLHRYYVEVCRRDLVGAFRRLQEGGHIEVLASCATHGFLPLLRHEPASARAQVEIGVQVYRERFGRHPQGFWLPECGFYPGLDEVLAAAGVRYVCVESHAVLNASSRPRRGVHGPLICPAGVAAFARDPECTRQVWSVQEGFPGDPAYREFFRDIGYELPKELIGRFLGPGGLRVPTGIKYHRITGGTEAKEPYVRSRALEKAREHAEQFLEWRKKQVEWLGGRLDRRPIVVAPYDAELFGHWWFEGPEWIRFLLEAAARDPASVLAVTPSEYLAEYPESQLAMPSASSWGEGGYSGVWLSPENDWIYPALHQAAADMADLAFRRHGAEGLERRYLDQAARELLLAQASDWSFILKTGTATGYAAARVRTHLERYFRLSEALHEGRLDEEEVGRLEEQDAIFPELDFRLFQAQLPRPGYAIQREPSHVAFLSAEMAPYVKVGGLADVAGALPAALAAAGLRVTVILPAYAEIDLSRYPVRRVASALRAGEGERLRTFDLLEVEETPPGVRVLLVERDEYFGRRGIYTDPVTREEYPDTAERFAFFTRAALESLRHLGEPVDIVHSHDHQTALAAAYVKLLHSGDPVLGLAACVYTLHNLGYQGAYEPEILEVAGLDDHSFGPGSPFEHHGRFNWMKTGIAFADKVSTVSSAYAREICEDPIQGAGLGEVLQERRRDLVGITNGIDTALWNPAADPLLPARYDADHPEGKKECKRELLERTGLGGADLEAPLAGMVTRLVDQKGLDLVVEAFDRLLARGLRLVVLGTGLEKYELFLRRAAERHPRSVAALLRFDDAMAHLIEAGSDIFLMPSLYEPCGLNQMYSLRYGTVPVVRETGGLADTVDDADRSPSGVGFTFHDYTPEAMLEALDRALHAYRGRERWRRIQRAGMRRNFSWAVAAGRYLDLYRRALAAASPRGVSGASAVAGRV